MGNAIKILLIDDDEDDFILTRDTLSEIPSRKYALDWEPDFEKARELVSRRLHDVYLVDFQIGAFSGLDLIGEAHGNGIAAPLILLTGKSDPEIDERAMRAGAADYLVKGTFGLSDLERSIRYSLEHAKNLAEIRKLNTSLEKRVEQRTRDLAMALQELEQTNENLLRAEQEILKALEKERELNALKSRFVTMASHEFRTPLSTVLSSAALIAKYNGPDDEPNRQRHIARIKSAVNNLTSILNDFLSISKLEEGKVVSNPVEFSVPELTGEVVEEMSGLVKPGQEIRCQHAGRTEVMLDKNLTRNILINLISNAIKYSGEGKPIEIRTDLQNAHLEIAVRDHGIGIPESEQAHMFSRFFRAQNASNIQGTGLGLTIVKRYVELMHGSIDFESRESKGTVFTIRIPV
ncbi:MAG: hybrid sensor histidine kinase/response regulator [Cytophagales bacterium]|jgi:signal transduction histidine kinase|nr:hybrid sensor histidine kinase/response regulator [Cytophagales bacterium]